MLTTRQGLNDHLHAFCNAMEAYLTDTPTGPLAAPLQCCSPSPVISPQSWCLDKGKPMGLQTITDSAPGTVLFPEYAELYDLIAREVTGLTDAQLDFRSDQWAWADWSIRRQLSHMASLIYGWTVVRLGQTLFPDGNHGVENIQSLTMSGFDRRLDDRRYWDLPIILQALYGGLALIQRVLAQRSVDFLRSHTTERTVGEHWRLMQQAHPSGVTLDVASGKVVMTIEAILRHIYFEETTHLYNIQRLKRAQGLSTVVAVPRVGYWTLGGWDRSEPSSDAEPAP